MQLGVGLDRHRDQLLQGPGTAICIKPIVLLCDIDVSMLGLVAGVGLYHLCDQLLQGAHVVQGRHCLLQRGLCSWGWP